MTEQEKRLNDLMSKDRNERIGSARQELRDSIENHGDPYGIADAFKEMSPFEKALGRLYGKLMQGKGNVQIDDAIAWFETEYSDLMDGNKFTDLQKNMILVYVIQQIVGPSAEGYRILRQVLVKLNQK